MAWVFLPYCMRTSCSVCGCLVCLHVIGWSGVTWSRVDISLISYSQAVWPYLPSELTIHGDNTSEEQSLLLAVGTAFALPFQVTPLLSPAWHVCVSALPGDHCFHRSTRAILTAQILCLRLCFHTLCSLIWIVLCVICLLVFMVNTSKALRILLAQWGWLQTLHWVTCILCGLLTFEHACRFCCKNHVL